MFNPILTGGGCQFSLYEICECRATAADRDTPFHEFFLSIKSYASFDTKFVKIGPSVTRSHNVLYSHVGSKFAPNLHFAYVCVQNT